MSNPAPKSFASEVLRSPIPVLVLFGATWCAPCKAMVSRVDSVVDESEGKVGSVKLDVDKNRSLAARYGIRSVPSLVLFHGGEPVGQLNGNQLKSSIQNLAAQAL